LADLAWRLGAISDVQRPLAVVDAVSNVCQAKELRGRSMPPCRAQAVREAASNRVATCCDLHGPSQTPSMRRRDAARCKVEVEVSEVRLGMQQQIIIETAKKKIHKKLGQEHNGE